MTIAMVQARMGSTRLPNKVMKKIQGKPVIFHVLNRLSRAERIDKIVLATSVNQNNDKLEEYVESIGFSVFRGNEDDVLERFYLGTKNYNADIIVRITGDCPLIDSEVVDKAIEMYVSDEYDYVSNVFPPTFPDGLDVEVFSFKMLEKAFLESSLKEDREHVTPYIRKCSDIRIGNLENDIDYSGLRWTLDDTNDFKVITRIFNELYNINKKFGMKDILELKKNNPELFIDNLSTIRNEGANMGKGQKLWSRAKQIIPGGNSLLSKRSEMFLPVNWPSYYSKAKGIEIWDLDGNHFKDFSIMGIGSNTLGYARDEVDSAVKNAIDNSSCSSLNCYEEVYLAEKLIDLHPWAEQVRYSRTGGEACTMAVRIARAASGKDGIAFCGYHGWHDWYLASNIQDDNNLNNMLLSGLEPNGVPKALGGTAFPFEYNRFDQLEKIIRDNDIGVIIMEPFRNKEPEDNFLSRVRELATEKNVILIFDEVTAAFRENLGGLHLKFGIEPDVAVFGKALGNGYPISAVIGKKAVMEFAQTTFISSTNWTERIGPVAALETLRIMEDESVPETINKLGIYVNQGWRKISEKNGLDIHIEGQPSISHFAFEDNNLLFKTYITQEMLKKGYLASNLFYISNVHNKDNIDEYLGELEEVIAKIATSDAKEIENLLDGPISHSGFQRLN